MSIDFNQKFHAVGQGLFYSSSLSQDGKQIDDINVIFDCGSDNIDFINAEVADFKKNGCKKVDILIISHLHYDHVSGLDELLKDIAVDTVVLPYLYPYERWLFQFANGTKAAWYSDFLANPYSWLNGKNIEKIVVINGGDNDDNNEPFSIEDIQPIESNEVQVKLQKSNKNYDSKNYDSNDIQNMTKISMYSGKGCIQIASLFFVFFNYKIKDAKKLIDFLAGAKITDTKSALDALKDKKKRKNLEDAYKIISTDLNVTSLAAYQGLLLPIKQGNHHYSVRSREFCPIDLLCCDCEDCHFDGHYHGYCRKNANKYELDFDFYCRCNKSCNSCKVLGTLLLGDIKLDYKRKQKELFDYFEKLLSSVKLLQLSHHGADNGWHQSLIDKIPKNSIYVASHGTRNKYHHPHKSVLLTLAQNHRRYISVTEENFYGCNLNFR